MSRHAYYEELKALAREKRALHGVDTAAFGLREVRGIYRAEGMKIDSWPAALQSQGALYGGRR